MGQLLIEAGTSLLNADHRIFQTVRLLIVAPGALTRAYIHGRRTRYLSPIALFIATSALLLLLDELIGVDNPVAQVDETRRHPLTGFFLALTTGLRIIAPPLQNYPALILPAYFIWIFALTRRQAKHPLFDATVFTLYSFSAFNMILLGMTVYEGFSGGNPNSNLSFALYAAHMAFHLKGTYRQSLLKSAGIAVLVVLLGFLTLIAFAALVGLAAVRLF